MKRLLLILLLMISCTKTPSFTEGRYESKLVEPVELNARISRDKTVSIPLTIDSGVVLIAHDNSDTTARVVSFLLHSWRGIVDQEDLVNEVKKNVGMSSKHLSDIVISMPRVKAEKILKELN